MKKNIKFFLESGIDKMASQQYKTVDLFKFIAALSILLLHVPPFRAGTFAYVVIREIITVFAVPFFFAASGFLQ